MNQADFLQARQFISTDIGRELDLVKHNSRGELGRAIIPGGGNLLAALGLLCYTEFGGKLRFAHTKSNGSDWSSKNFTDFFLLLGPNYAALSNTHNVYSIFRCGMAHEYYVKHNCEVSMLSGGHPDGIGIDASGKFFFVVETYFHALMRQLDALELHLFPGATPTPTGQW